MCARAQELASRERQHADPVEAALRDPKGVATLRKDEAEQLYARRVGGAAEAARCLVVRPCIAWCCGRCCALSPASWP